MHFAILMMLALQTPEADQTLRWNLPEPVHAAFFSPAFEATFELGGWVNPFYLRGDFDGDGRVDYAVLVTRRDNRKKGIAVWLSSRSGSSLVMIGAGTPARAGEADTDDWSFFDVWQVYPRGRVRQGVGEGPPPRLKGDALLIEKSESASGLVYWDGKRFHWYQQED